MRYQISKLTPERFEELAKELLCLDGFKNVTLNAIGTDDGWDGTADKIYQIAHGQEHSISWMIQCKRVSNGRALSGTVVKEILNNFGTQDEHQGLIIITNTKIPAAAITRMKNLSRSRHRFVFHWDVTDIEKFIEEHPFLIDKFNLDGPTEALDGAGDIRALILSDGSVFAYHVFETLRKYGFDVRETRLHQFGANALSSSPFELAKSFDIAIVFLAELYWWPVQPEILQCLKSCIGEGLNVLFTPFCAWSVESRVNGTLDELLPVRVQERAVNLSSILLPDPSEISEEFPFPDYRDTFIENQRIFFTVAKGAISSRELSCSLRSTFEFLTPKPEAEVLVSDSQENPVLVVGRLGRGQTAYLNMCAHNCLTPFPLKSPVESDICIGRFFADFCLWFGER